MRHKKALRKGPVAIYHLPLTSFKTYLDVFQLFIALWH